MTVVGPVVAQFCNLNRQTSDEARVPNPGRTAEQVTSSVDRYEAHIPGAFWEELDESGLVAGAAS